MFDDDEDVLSEIGIYYSRVDPENSIDYVKVQYSFTYSLPHGSKRKEWKQYLWVVADDYQTASERIGALCSHWNTEQYLYKVVH